VFSARNLEAMGTARLVSPERSGSSLPPWFPMLWQCMHPLFGEDRCPVPTEEGFISMRSRGTFPAIGPDFRWSRRRQSNPTGGLFMVDISICLIFVAMILIPFIVDSIHRPCPARAVTETDSKNAVRSSVCQPS